MTTDQLSLGTLISVLEKQDPRLVLPKAFYKPHSFRGDYSHLAFERLASSISINALLIWTRGALGHTYAGWKGGTYTMMSCTPVWLATEGTIADAERLTIALLATMIAAANPVDLAEVVRGLKMIEADLR